jgi:oxalate decarboxylase/phosphoglucose isomerase-like protein (cupin superfamily)
MNSEIKLIQLPKILDRRGNLSFFENGNQIPFEIKRTYWIYDVPGGEVRGSHAFKKSNEFIIALSGSFDIILNDGNNESKFSLNRSYYGLLVPNMYWRKIENFSTNSLALIVSSIGYTKEDYIYDFEEFKSLKNETKK